MRNWAAVAFLLMAATAARAACITDDTGQKVCLERPAARVASLYGAFTEIVNDLDAAPALVARTASDDAAPASLPSVGTGLRPDVETLLALGPDLVLCRSGKAAAEALAALRARGLTVAAFDPRSPAEVFTTFERLGTLLGKEKAAASRVAEIRAQLARVEKVVSGTTRRPRVIFEVRAEPLSVAGADSLFQELLKIAGGENAMTVNRSVVSCDVEALLAADPDLYLVQEGPMNRRPSSPADRPNFKALRSVSQGRVAVLDEALISRPGPRIGQAAETLSRLLHPDLWRDVPPK